MKIKEWKNLNFYKYFYSGISNSGDTVYLDISNQAIKTVNTFAYISEIPLIENIMGVKLSKKILTNTSFSYNLDISYGSRIDKDIITIEIGTKHDSRNFETTKSFLGVGFNIDVTSYLWSTRDVAWGIISYRFSRDGVYSDWVEIYNVRYQDSHGLHDVDHKQVYINQQAHPITKESYFEVKIMGGAGRLGSIQMDVHISPFTYTEQHTNSGKIHWFAFVK